MLEDLKEFKTDRTTMCPHPLVGSNVEIGATVDIKHFVYKGQMFKIINKYIELKRKQKFYNTWYGKMFYNGRYNLIDIEYAIDKIENIDMFLEFLD